MKHRLPYFCLASFALLVSYLMPLQATKTVEVGQPSFAVVKRSEPLQQPKIAPKQELASMAVATPVAAPVAPQAVYSGSGDQYLDWIIQHESSGNPYAVNEIGACGLYQALPCAKMGCELSNVSCQLAWGKQYAVSRYGSTYAAMLFWQSNRWW